MIGENQVDYRFFIGFKLVLNDQVYLTSIYQYFLFHLLTIYLLSAFSILGLNINTTNRDIAIPFANSK